MTIVYIYIYIYNPVYAAVIMWKSEVIAGALVDSVFMPRDEN